MHHKQNRGRNEFISMNATDLSTLMHVKKALASITFIYI